MTMGETIKYHRKRLGLTQEELGKRLNPVVQTSGITKWEKGRVENIKRSHIEQLAELFDIKPSDLMCFDSVYDTPKLAEEVKTLEMIQKCFGKESVQFLQMFQKLNNQGKEKLIADLEDMVQLKKYTEDELLKNA